MSGNLAVIEWEGLVEQRCASQSPVWCRSALWRHCVATEGFDRPLVWILRRVDFAHGDAAFYGASV
eukprot:4145330-Prymnesium_polylepis.1